MKIFDTEIERVTTRYGRLYIASRDSVIGRSLKIYGEWAENEISTYAALLSDGDTIVDVGANIGTHAVALASRFPHSKIVAFEPQPLAFSLLTTNVLAAKTANVYPRNLGCAEVEKVIHVSPDYGRVDWNVGAFSIVDAASDRRDASPVLLVSLDNLAFARRVQFIKIDVEGMEESVLAGAKQLISRDRPIIYFELLQIERLNGISSMLTELGYDLRWLKSEAFNRHNFRLNPENVWSRGETGVLGLPNADDPRVAHLDPVTTEEREVPVIEYSGS